MTGADKIEVPSQSQNLGEKNGSLTVSTLIDGGAKITWKGTKGTASGTAKKDPAGIDKIFHGDQAKGHYFPIKFTDKCLSKELTLTGSKDGEKTLTPSVEDPYLIVRLENLTANKLTAKVKATQEEVFEIDFSGVTQQAGEP